MDNIINIKNLSKLSKHYRYQKNLLIAHPYPLEEFGWLQLNAKIIGQLSLLFYFLSLFASTSFSMFIMLLLVAFIVLQITLGSRLLPNFQNNVIWTIWQLFVNIFRHVNHSFRLLRASSNLSRSVVSDLLTLYGVRGDDGVMDDDVGDVQFYSYRIYKVCLFVIYGFALG